MVLRKGTGKGQWTMGHANCFKQKKYDSARKNELLYPISPYDEIPTIRDLVNQLSPEPRQGPSVRREATETRQTRQESVRKHMRLRIHQQRHTTKSPFDAPPSFPLCTNDAHEVPTTIEMPIIPSHSKDSELSLDECLRCSDEDYRDQPSLASDSVGVYDVNFQPVSADMHQEMDWPSDEDTAPPKKTKVMTERHNRKAEKLNRYDRLHLV